MYEREKHSFVMISFFVEFEIKVDILSSHTGAPASLDASSSSLTTFTAIPDSVIVQIVRLS